MPLSAQGNELASSLQIAGDLDEPIAAVQTLARYAKSRAAQPSQSPDQWAALAQRLDAITAELAQTNKTSD